MVEAMKSVAKMDVELTVEERNLLSVAYKNVIGARRASSRIISSIEQKEENKGNEQHVAKIKEYRQKVENELSGICNDILTIRECFPCPPSNVPRLSFMMCRTPHAQPPPRPAHPSTSLPPCSRPPPHPLGHHWRVQGVLLQDEG